MDRFQTIITALVCVIVIATLGAVQIHKQATEHMPEKAKLPDVKPNPVDGLHLGKCYRPRADLSWDWNLREWKPGRNGHGFLQRGTPLFVVERIGNTARLRGAITDCSVIVPDGPSSAWFYDVGDLGELPFGDLPEKQQELK